VQALFFDELAELLDWVATMAEPLFVVGDLNVRLDRADDVHAARLVDLLAAYWFENRVSATNSSARRDVRRRRYSLRFAGSDREGRRRRSIRP